jgi:hypothetical protein
MAREMILRCNLCGATIDQAAGKVYLVPKIPGSNSTFVSAYSASGDLCSNCTDELDKKLDKRKSRNGGTSKHSRTSRKKTTR